MTDERADGRLERLIGAERAKAFMDAVVAIAMTLLILPLMESVTSLTTANGGAAHWFDAHHGQLIAFVISFVVIASFWANQHQLFAGVTHVSPLLLWVSFAWLLSIVWMPVATALTGQATGEDPVVTTVYVGTMLAASLLALAQRMVLRADPALHRLSEIELRNGLATDIAMAVLFAASLAVALLWPVIGLWALFLMMLTGLMRRLFTRMLGVPRSPSRRPAHRSGS